MANLHIAQAIGITGAAFLSGGILTFSYVLVPALQDAPDSIMVRQCRIAYDQSMKALPLLSLISASSFSFLSYKLVKTLNQAKGELYALAALVTISVVPYTLLAMVSTNRKLLGKTLPAGASESVSGHHEREEGSNNDESAKELLARWRLLNFGRGVLPLLGTSLGLYATIT